MKVRFPLQWLLLSVLPLNTWAQDEPVGRDSLQRSVARAECPAVLLAALSDDSLKAKAALFIINRASNPLGKEEFRDHGKRVKWLNVQIRMNRITLLYVEPGLHRFHTMYMKKSEAVKFEANSPLPVSKSN